MLTCAKDWFFSVQLRLVLPFAVLLLAPTASACLGVGAAVYPSLEIIVPEKQTCRNVEDCDPVGALNESRRYEGVIRWSWPVDLICMGDYAPPTGDMVITIEASDKTPSWMNITPDPRQYTVSPADQVDLSDDEFDQASGTWTVVWQRPVNFTITRTGVPVGHELMTLFNQDGVVKVTAKAQSTVSGGVQAAYTKEEFKYDARELLVPTDDGTDQGSPPVPLGLLLIGLTCVVVAMRRRS